MSDPERRNTERSLTELPIALQDEKGVVLDDHAVAHDVSAKGFRLETHVDLAPGQVIRYRLALAADRDLRGSAKVVWSQRTDFGLWAGAEFSSLSWSDKRLLRRVLKPRTADWVLITMKVFLATFWISVILAFWYGVRSPFWRPQIFWLAPKAVAGVILGWSLRELLTGDS